MKSLYAPGLWAVVGVMVLASWLPAAEPFGSASLLPMPSVPSVDPSASRVAPASFGLAQSIVSPSDQSPPGFARPLSISPSAGLSQDYPHAMKDSWDGSACADRSCDDAACCAPCRPCPRFYAYGGALVLGRANQSDRAITQNSPGDFSTILSTSQAEQDWSAGFETRLGWVLPGCCNAFEFGYWGIFPEDPSSCGCGHDFTGGIAPALGLNLDQVWYDDGLGNSRSVYDWMSTSTGTHRLTRGFEYHSAELNFLGNTQAWGAVPFGAGCGDCNGCIPCGSCGPRRWQFGWLGGLRYFQFNEALLLETDFDDESLNGTDDFDELAYAVNTNNTLLGFQFGGQGSWYIHPRFSVYGGGRFGVFNNYVRSTQYLSGDAGDAFINDGAFAGDPYRFTAAENVLACVGQLDLGLRYQLGRHWSITGGYRVVGISGVATAPDQIPDNFADSRYVEDISAEDSVILHGSYLGAQFAW